MKKYEILYILRPNIEEIELNKNIENINNIFNNEDSKIMEFKKIGLKDLAYPIDKHYKGYYTWLLISTTPKIIEEFNRIVRITENIIRFIVIKEE